MGKKPASNGIDEQLAHLVNAMYGEGVAGGTISSDGATTGIPDWFERTRNQRFAQKVHSHGYPLGLAKSTLHGRARRRSELMDRLAKLPEATRQEFFEAFEALAYAIDAERFLGSFTGPRRSAFLAREVDFVAENIVIWLQERGYKLTRVEWSEESEWPISDPHTPELERPDDCGHPLSEVDYDRHFGKGRWESAIRSGEGLTPFRDRLSNWTNMRISWKSRQLSWNVFHSTSVRRERKDQIERYRRMLYGLSDDERRAYYEAHEALAYAIDAERFFGAMPADDVTGDSETLEINSFANRLLVWIDVRGHKIVPK